jgi:hypothetical protein
MVRYKGVRALASAARSLGRTLWYSRHSASLCPYLVPLPEQPSPHCGHPQPSHLDNIAACSYVITLVRPD